MFPGPNSELRYISSTYKLQEYKSCHGSVNFSHKLSNQANQAPSRSYLVFLVRYLNLLIVRVGVKELIYLVILRALFVTNLL